MSAVVQCDNVVHIYSADEEEVVALRGADLTITEGESVSLLGPSGAGKSTLLWLLAGLLKPSAGSVRVLGQDVGRMTARGLARMRAGEIGVVMQNPLRNLLTYATAVENVAFGQRSADVPRGGRRAAAGELLDAVGLADAAHRRAGAMSGGEQQRLALAVALSGRPKVLLADEPTSQLDRASGARVVDLLRWANSEYGSTLVVVTHDPDVSGAFARTITIRDGRVGAEGHLGEEFVVVGREASLQLPPDLREEFPPGTLVRVVRTDSGVELRRVDRPAEGAT
ncbi:MAG TPA: ABC transporter ATP-binding protein [Streptosporangiaceae bacterium]|jgi:ABC-type lipoprotein export system ATPase subunit